MKLTYESTRTLCETHGYCLLTPEELFTDGYHIIVRCPGCSRPWNVSVYDISRGRTCEPCGKKRAGNSHKLGEHGFYQNVKTFLEGMDYTLETPADEFLNSAFKVQFRCTQDHESTLPHLSFRTKMSRYKNKQSTSFCTLCKPKPAPSSTPKEQKPIVLVNHMAELSTFLERKGCQLVSVDSGEVVSGRSKVTYVCKCLNTFTKVYRDLKRDQACRKCTSLKYRAPSTNELITDEDGTRWAAVPGGFISEYGQAKNADGTLKVVTEGRYTFNHKNYYVARLMALAFKIDGWEKLTNPDGTTNQSYVVGHTTDQKTYALQDLKVMTKREMNQGKHYTTREQTISIQPGEQVRTVPEYPNHLIYESGHIRRLNGTFLRPCMNTEGYLVITLNPTIKVHRLVCYAFHPKEGFTCLQDYSALQVNHKDKNKANNAASNLEWCTQSENQLHACADGETQRTRGVLRYDLEDEKYEGPFVAYPSIAEAARQTGCAEHAIRETCRGKRKTLTDYRWQYERPEDSVMYSLKYSK
jgi:hypothetical protein